VLGPPKANPLNAPARGGFAPSCQRAGWNAPRIDLVPDLSSAAKASALA